ncbi:hypothetical protein QBC38DRAFT_382832 [Podospora fimiseda]|uniref:Uncharacterized protein n=1 Tax=Podospora fimiseda TaxID=252190 RepID=A0AAN7BWX1_9PEZI|nr:hypothetical protein QBC38DRAFT_382832 [Podospora fimiseda]
MVKTKPPIAKNGNITSFFKPVPKSSQTQSSQPDPLPQPPAPRPSTPPPPTQTPKPRPRDAVIKASDDEDEDSDDDSDDEFPDLFRPAYTLKNETSLLETPRKNRISVDIFSSPLTINAKRPKFEMSTLLKHAAANDRINETARAINAMLENSGSPTRGSSPSSGKDMKKSLHESMMEMMSDDEYADGERVKKEKLLRAVKRIEADVGRREWYFFRDENDSKGTSTKGRRAFPKAQATGVWKFLAAEKGRSKHFERGLPWQLQKARKNLPDEIFLWVLNAAVREKSYRLRDGYLKLLAECPLQAGRVVDEQLIEQLFRNLGASEEALAIGLESKKVVSQPKRPDYLDQDWTSLATVLRILSSIAVGLAVEPLTKIMALMLRLGIDEVVREEPAVSKWYQQVLRNVAKTIPERCWNEFCYEISHSIYSHTSEVSLRWNIVSAIPIMSTKLVDLRRRLALVFVFSEPQFALMKPDETFSMKSVLQQIKESEDFMIDRNHTDFHELKAMFDLLSVAVADGVKPSSAAGPSRQYDEEVDETAQILKLLWSGIHEGGAAFESRLGAKAQLKDFERKLLHVVRSRPPRKDNILEIAQNREMREVREYTASKSFMSRFLGNKEPTASDTPTIP